MKTKIKQKTYMHITENKKIRLNKWEKAYTAVLEIVLLIAQNNIQYRISCGVLGLANASQVAWTFKLAKPFLFIYSSPQSKGLEICTCVQSSAPIVLGKLYFSCQRCFASLISSAVFGTVLCLNPVTLPTLFWQPGSEMYLKKTFRSLPRFSYCSPIK